MTTAYAMNDDIPPPESAKPAEVPRKWRTPEERANAIGLYGARITTGIPTLDKVTRGGLLPRRILGLGGAPGAGKTTLGLQLARRFALAGHHVAIVAADEDGDGLLIRWAQQENVPRADIEHGNPPARARLSHALHQLPRLMLVDQDEEDDAMLEDVVEELVRRRGDDPKEIGVLFVDSIQQVRTRESVDADGPRARIDCVMAALKRAAKQHGLLAIATSEVTRGYYRGGKDGRIDALAAFKESSSIEYGIAVGVAMSSVKGGGGLVDVEFAKNRLGRKDVPFRLRLDDDRAIFTEVAMPPPEDVGSVDAADLFADDVEAAREALRANPGINGNDGWLAKIKSAREMSKDRARAAIRCLNSAGEIENRGTTKRPRLHLVEVSNDTVGADPPESPESPGDCGDCNPPDPPHPYRGAGSGRVQSGGFGEPNSENGAGRVPSEVAE